MRKIISMIAAAAMAVPLLVASPGDAQAYRRHRGGDIAAGVAAAVIGGIIISQIGRRHHRHRYYDDYDNYDYGYYRPRYYSSYGYYQPRYYSNYGNYRPRYYSRHHGGGNWGRRHWGGHHGGHALRVRGHHFRHR